MKYRGTVSNAESLGRMVAQGRLLNHLTQRELADRLGISQRYVWEIEAGKPTKHRPAVRDVPGHGRDPHG